MILAKRLSEKEKEEITKSFTFGKSIEELSTEFKCTKLTITRNLNKNLGEKKFKELIRNFKSLKTAFNNSKIDVYVESELNKNRKINNDKLNLDKNIVDGFKGELPSENPFIELTPLDYEIENTPQKELSSVPISDIEFPKVAYMVVDKKIELEIKNLKDYPDWQFLSESELNRKTIEIHLELKDAKRYCNKEQKVIKIPNPKVFKIVAPVLLHRGISRIVCSDRLISL